MSPSPVFIPVIPPGTETLGPINHGESRGSNAPSLPSHPDGMSISYKMARSLSLCFFFNLIVHHPSPISFYQYLIHCYLLSGLAISPSPANLHVYPSPIETPGSSHQRESWRTTAPRSPAVTNGNLYSLSPLNNLCFT